MKERATQLTYTDLPQALRLRQEAKASAQGPAPKVPMEGDSRAAPYDPEVAEDGQAAPSEKEQEPEGEATE